MRIYETGEIALMFDDIEELEAKIKAYLDTTGWIKKKILDRRTGKIVEIDFYEPATVSNLAVALGTNRQTLANYEKRDKYYNIIKRAKAQCEANLEYGALTGKLNPMFSIFSCKNNYGWKDSRDVNLTDGRELRELTDEELDAELLKANPNSHLLKKLPPPQE